MDGTHPTSLLDNPLSKGRGLPRMLELRFFSNII